jgi:hypothetical protein
VLPSETPQVPQNRFKSGLEDKHDKQTSDIFFLELEWVQDALSLQMSLNKSRY